MSGGARRGGAGDGDGGGRERGRRRRRDWFGFTEDASERTTREPDKVASGV